MRKFSTLLYFVNSFQEDLNKVESSGSYEGLKKKLTESEKDLEPPEQTIANILSFARSYEVIETKAAGYAEMILN